jgi:hypothetical protein
MQNLNQVAVHQPQKSQARSFDLPSFELLIPQNHPLSGIIKNGAKIIIDDKNEFKIINSGNEIHLYRDGSKTKYSSGAQKCINVSRSPTMIAELALIVSISGSKIPVIVGLAAAGFVGVLCLEAFPNVLCPTREVYEAEKLVNVEIDYSNASQEIKDKFAELEKRLDEREYVKIKDILPEKKASCFCLDLFSPEVATNQEVSTNQEVAGVYRV